MYVMRREHKEQSFPLGGLFWQTKASGYGNGLNCVMKAEKLKWVLQMGRLVSLCDNDKVR